jgi:hypothetical protein
MFGVNHGPLFCFDLSPCGRVDAQAEREPIGTALGARLRNPQDIRGARRSAGLSADERMPLQIIAATQRGLGCLCTLLPGAEDLLKGDIRNDESSLSSISSILSARPREIPLISF